MQVYISNITIALKIWKTNTYAGKCKTGTNYSRGTSLIGKSVRDFFRAKGFIRIFDGFFMKTKGFLPKVYEILGSGMPLEITVSIASNKVAILWQNVFASQIANSSAVSC